MLPLYYFHPCSLTLYMTLLKYTKHIFPESSSSSILKKSMTVIVYSNGSLHYSAPHWHQPDWQPFASILLCRHVSSSFINSGTVQGARYHLQGTEKQGVPLKPSGVQLQTIISLNYSAGAPQFDITLRT